MFRYTEANFNKITNINSQIDVLLYHFSNDADPRFVAIKHPNQNFKKMPGRNQVLSASIT